MKTKKLTTLHLRNSISSECFRGSLLIALATALAWFALLPTARADDDDLGNGNTAEGHQALFSLPSTSPGTNNTANGAYALQLNTTGSNNTAIGYGALNSNKTISTVSGNNNTAIGFEALYSNTTGTQNTATGYQALYSNTTGDFNTANGQGALFKNTGDGNTANGQGALYNNTSGVRNTAIGVNALKSNTMGNDNVALGAKAGFSVTGDGNICIGHDVLGGSGSNITRIANIGSTLQSSGIFVTVDSVGGTKLGYESSSRRFKHDVKPMDKASEALLALNPVTFRYNGDIDPSHVQNYGLIAEEVDKVAPDLVVRNQKGEPETLRFDSINAMLLNEFLKEHRKVQEQEAAITQLKSTAAKQEASIAEQQKQIEALSAGLQKVSAQVEMSRPAPQMVLNNQ